MLGNINIYILWLYYNSQHLLPGTSSSSKLFIPKNIYFSFGFLLKICRILQGNFLFKQVINQSFGCLVGFGEGLIKSLDSSLKVTTKLFKITGDENQFRPLWSKNCIWAPVEDDVGARLLSSGTVFFSGLVLALGLRSSEVPLYCGGGVWRTLSLGNVQS